MEAVFFLQSHELFNWESTELFDRYRLQVDFVYPQKTHRWWMVIPILNSLVLKSCLCCLLFFKVMVRKCSDICWFNVCGWPGCVKTLKPSWWVNSQSCGSKSSVVRQRLGSPRCIRWFQSSNCRYSWMFGMLIDWRHPDMSTHDICFLFLWLNQVWAATSMSEVLLEMQTAQWPHSYYSYRFIFFTFSAVVVKSNRLFL